MAATPATRPPRVDRRTRAGRAADRGARDELLAAAAEVFAERGFQAASIDEIAHRAGYSKGAVYWHFRGKDDLFLALLEERIDRPVQDAIELLESAPPEHDMAPEASQVLTRLFRGERELLLLEHEYWSRAVRYPELRRHYVNRRRKLQRAFAKAIAARIEHLGEAADIDPAEAATAFLSLGGGLAREKLVNPSAVPDHLLGEIFALVYTGAVARARARR